MQAQVLQQPKVIASAAVTVLTTITLGYWGLSQQGPQPVHITTLATLTEEEGLSVRLTCDINLKPEVLHWKKDDAVVLAIWKNGVLEDIFDKDNFVVESGYTLTIKAARKSDEGRYNCTARNKGLHGTNQTHLTVKDAVVQTQAQLKGDEGFSVTMPCTFRGKPSQVIWRREYTFSTTHMVRWQDGTKSGECLTDNKCDVNSDFSFTIHRAIQDDAGTYVCAISYYPGHEATGSTELTVPAGVIKTHDKITVDEGNRVDIPCAFKGTPHEAFWMKGSETLVKMQEGGAKDGSCFNTKTCDVDRLFTLIIYSAKSSDRGRYTCSVRYRKDQEQPLASSTDLGVKQQQQQQQQQQQPQVDDPTEPETSRDIPETPYWLYPLIYTLFGIFVISSSGATFLIMFPQYA